jgi:hypothetical protein
LLQWLLCRLRIFLRVVVARTRCAQEPTTRGQLARTTPGLAPLMEVLFPHHLARANTNSPPIAVLDASAVSRSPRALQAALDALGVASAEAQRLPAPITSAARMACDASQRVYVALPWGYSGGGAPCAPLGFLKVGQRALYLAVPPRAAGSAGVPDPSALVSSLAATAAAAAAAAAGSGGDRRGGGARGSRRLLAQQQRAGGRGAAEAWRAATESWEALAPCGSAARCACWTFTWRAAAGARAWAGRCWTA